MPASSVRKLSAIQMAYTVDGSEGLAQGSRQKQKNEEDWMM